MSLTASQHRKLIREGKIAYSRHDSVLSPRPSRSLLRQGIDFAKAMTSGAASEELKAKRLAVCAACPGGHRHTVDGHDYCKACHCPSWRFARLDNKAGLAMDTCTEGHWKSINV